jgi:hypothetical protein
MLCKKYKIFLLSHCEHCFTTVHTACYRWTWWQTGTSSFWNECLPHVPIWEKWKQCCAFRRWVQSPSWRSSRDEVHSERWVQPADWWQQMQLDWMASLLQVSSFMIDTWNYQVKLIFWYIGILSVLSSFVSLLLLHYIYHILTLGIIVKEADVAHVTVDHCLQTFSLTPGIRIPMILCTKLKLC